MQGRRALELLQELQIPEWSPGKSTPISPRGLISTDTPTFTWTAASAATTYHLEVINYHDGIDVPVMEDASIDANKVTIGSRCSFILGTLPDDDSVYYWRIHASNDAGDGTWSGWRYFETMCALKAGYGQEKSPDGIISALLGKDAGVRPTLVSSILFLYA